MGLKSSANEASRTKFYWEYYGFGFPRVRKLLPTRGRNLVGSNREVQDEATANAD